jgi:hypothetical protein
MFVRYSSRQVPKHGITLSKSHVITIAKGITEQYALRAGDRVSLWWDEDSRRIGVQMHGDLDIPGSYAVVNTGTMLAVSAIGFAKTFQPSLGRYDVVYDSAAAMLVCSPVGGSN